MKIKLGSFREKITYLLFWGCLFCASMYMFESYSGMVSSILLLTLSVLIYLFNIKSLAKSQILNCLIILLFIMFSMVVNRSFASIDIRTVVIVISSYLVIQSLSYEDFLKKYTDCIMVIALFSIAAYFLYKVAPGAFGAFPRQLWRNHSVLFVNLWLSVVPVGMQDYFRNFGIFYEPGIFQFYLNIALLIELFSNKKINVFRVLVLTVAVITTLSTNGYISIVLVFFAYGLFVILGSGNRDKIYIKNRDKLYRKIGFLALLSVIAIIFVVLIDKGIIGSRVFMKFSSTKTSGSYYDRTNAISYALSKIFQNPLLGVAARGIEDSYNATFTPLNWMMLYGIVIEGYALVGYSKMFSRLTSNRWLKIFVVAAAFSTILTQDLSFEWIVWCFIFCGIKNVVSKYNEKSELY